MSSNNDEYKIDMVRILQLNKTDVIDYKNNVTIQILSHVQRPTKYLRIKSDGKSLFTQEFCDLQLLHESSTTGVTTIRSSKNTIIIIYDTKNELLVNFFNDLKQSLTQFSQPKTAIDDSVLSQSNQDQIESMANDLIKLINSGASDEVEHITQKLAELRPNIQFNLISKNDNQDHAMLQSKPNGYTLRSPHPALQLSLRIECALQKDPIIALIDIRFGTTLQSLKQKIEKETGIKSTDQYWFASDQYLIPNDYVFGSTVSFVLNRSKQGSLAKPIQSGDMLTMYIAQMSPIQ